MTLPLQVIEGAVADVQMGGQSLCRRHLWQRSTKSWLRGKGGDLEESNLWNEHPAIWPILLTMITMIHQYYSILIYWYIYIHNSIYTVYPCISSISSYLHHHVSTKTWHGNTFIQEVKSQGQATSAGLSWASRGPSDRIPVGSLGSPAVGSRFQHLK